MKLTRRERKAGKTKKRKIIPPVYKNQEPTSDIQSKKKTVIYTIIFIGLWGVYYYLQRFNFNNYFPVSYIDVLVFFIIGIVFILFYRYFGYFPFLKEKDNEGNDYFEAFSFVLVLSVILHFSVLNPLKRIYTEYYGYKEDVYDSILLKKRESTQKTGKHSSRKVFYLKLKSSKYGEEEIEVSEKTYQRLSINDKVFLERTNSSMGYYIKIESIQKTQ